MSGLLVLSMSVAAFPVPVTAQVAVTGGAGLESAKMHLIEATKDLKMGNSQAALAQLNMTHQGIISAERQLNASVICNNVNNEGYCVAP
jgi:hypothetical protein